MNSIRTYFSKARILTNQVGNGRAVIGFRYATAPRSDGGLSESIPATPRGTPTPTSTDTTPTQVRKGPSPLEALKEAPMQMSTPTGQEKTFSPKISTLVDDISRLSLLEVADLNELLKKRLNIPDAPMMGPMSFATGPAAPAADEDEEAEAPKKVQTSFTLKLLKFDETKKVALIKECKSVLEGLNLVGAKKFVESAPCVVRADIAKDEAEKLQKALEAAGATCEIV